MMKVFNRGMSKVLALFVFVFILTRCNISNNHLIIYKTLARDGVISFILALISSLVSLSKAMVRIAFAFDV